MMCRTVTPYDGFLGFLLRQSIASLQPNLQDVHGTVSPPVPLPIVSVQTATHNYQAPSSNSSAWMLVEATELALINSRVRVTYVEGISGA